MIYSNFNGIPNQIYVIHRPTKRIVKLAENYREGVDYIDSIPVPERYEYSNYSRHQLAKDGLFPNTKAGNESLQTAINAEQVKRSIESNFDLKDIKRQLLLDRLDLSAAIKRGNGHQARICSRRIVQWVRQMEKVVSETVLQNEFMRVGEKLIETRLPY